MNKNAQIVKEILDIYFPDPGIPLHHSNPYTLLVAVVLSARSTDAMVNRVTPKLFEKASTPEKMAHLSEAEIREIIKPCGLSPQKAKALRSLSQILVDDFKGKVPATFEELESLPGVGHKTASVVMAQAFDIPAFPVDTHIFRCARRWGLSEGKTVKRVENDLKKIYLPEDWIRLHLQIIHFARKFCKSGRHFVANCPICSVLSK